MEVVTRKKLIEVGLPLERINEAAAREKSIRHGHPSTLHLWWARRPLAAARAVIFAQMVDDPSSHPERFKTEEAQEKERQRLFRIIEELAVWENTTNERVLNAAREEIWRSWRWTCEDNRGHPRVKELFDPKRLPAFHDPFAGGGALPLEAQRLGLESYASDLNPVAVLINKAMIEIPPKFAGRPPVNPATRKEQSKLQGRWRGASGLAEDVRYYGRWIRDEAERRIGHLYPKIEITADMAKERSDLQPIVGMKLTVIAWLWARTVRSPNPAFALVDVPLASTFMLSTKVGKEAYVEPVIEHGRYRFTVKAGKPKDAEATKNGTKLARGANFRCVMSDTPMDGDYIKAEGKAGRMGARLMAIVAVGERGRVYLSPTPEHEAASRIGKPDWKPEVTISGSTQYLGVKPYGMDQFSQLFTDRQLVTLSTLSDLVQEARLRAKGDAESAGLLEDGRPLAAGGIGADAYADALTVYLAFGMSKTTNRANMLATWMTSVQCPGHLFRRHAIPMSWDFSECNAVAGPSGSFWSMIDDTATSLEFISTSGACGSGLQADASQQLISTGKVVSTDPPYYDNVPYADLSDFFYVWLRRSLKAVFPELFTTLTVPKSEELVAFAYRHDGKVGAERFFLDGMTKAMHGLANQAHPVFPVTIYYAFKQSERDGDEGTASTGWETFLDAVIRAGFATTGTWPVRTERENRSRNQDSNALASSIVLVCRPRATDAPTATRREFVNALKAELPNALAHLQAGSIAPVDLAQAAIGPGMAVYTRYSRVLETDGSQMQVRTALQIINQELDAILAATDSEYDADSRWAVKWFDQYGNEDGPSGDANTLANAMNVGVNGLMEAGIVACRGNKVRLLRRAELHGGSPLEWDPTKDVDISAWEAVQHVIHRHQETGVPGAAALVAALGVRADAAKDLAYRLYNICERKKWQTEALAYNALVAEWNDIVQASTKSAKPAEGSLFG